MAGFNVRKKAKVTGSTMYKALGMRTLKEQKKQFYVVIDGKAISEYPEKV